MKVKIFKTVNKFIDKMAFKSVFAMRSIGSFAACNLLYRPNLKDKCSFCGSKSLYLQKIGLKKVIGRLSTLRTWMLTNVMEEDDSSSCLKI